MALRKGTRLGPYQITDQIAVGIGEVYRALDTRLDRNVAIKVLPEHLASDPLLRERFEREAKAVSSLNHPHICILYDVGEQDGTHFLVMELVEGKTLQKMLRGGPLPVPNLFSIANQIADALAAAHQGGVIHRDLKPANVMVSQDAQVKILDFGLAKHARLDDMSPTLEDAPTLLTHAGAVMGTCGYMSPEQARGEALDYRTDQFSFGAVLYEMGTGRRAFPGATEMDALAAVMRDRPDPMNKYNPQVPAPFEWIVDRCLAKAPQDRYESTRELANELAALGQNLARARVEARPRSHNLPAQRTALVGREREIAETRELALQPHIRLLTLTGPGGIGKTRLAIELASQLLDQFPGGVVFVALDRINDPELVSSEIANAMAVQITGDCPPNVLLTEHVRGSCTAPTLLLLDSFEHVVSAAPLLKDLLSATEQLKLLVTSRTALRLYGEHEYAVPPLELSDADASTDACLETSPAVVLFLQRATALQTGAVKKMDRDQLRLVGKICTRLDGLPLAIELAAARTKVLPLRALLDRLQDPLHLLAGGPRDLPERQRTLQATIDWSYKLLEPGQQRLFRRLSVFVGGATHEAIEAVCDPQQDLGWDLLDAIESLVDNSLLRWIGDSKSEPRFGMLDTMREYGLTRLAEAEEEAYMQKAHAAYCVVLAEDSAREISGPQRELWFSRLDADMGNFRAALDWLVESGEAQWGMRLGTALVAYLRERGLVAEGNERLARLLALPAAAPPNRVRGWALASASDLLPDTTGNLERKLQLLDESVAILTSLGDTMGVVRSTTSWGVVLDAAGDYVGARSKFEQAANVAREWGQPAALAAALSNLGDIVKRAGDYDQAQELYEESARLFAEAGDETAVVWGVSHRADLARERGHQAEARSLYEQALERFRGLENQLGVAGSYFDLASLDADDGDYSSAERLFGESLKIYSDLGYRPHLPRVLEAFARCAAACGQAERALTLAGSVAALRRASPDFEIPKAELEESLDAARRRLTGSQITQSWMRGFNMPFEEAVRFALGEG